MLFGFIQPRLPQSNVWIMLFVFFCVISFWFAASVSKLGRAFIEIAENKYSPLNLVCPISPYNSVFLPFCEGLWRCWRKWKSLTWTRWSKNLSHWQRMQEGFRGRPSKGFWRITHQQSICRIWALMEELTRRVSRPVSHWLPTKNWSPISTELLMEILLLFSLENPSPLCL